MSEGARPPSPESGSGRSGERSPLVRSLAVQLLQGPVDLDRTIETAAGAVLGIIADSCTVFLSDYDTLATARASRHRDPTLETAIAELAERYRPDEDAAEGSPVAGALAGEERRVDWRVTEPADETTRSAVERLSSKAWMAIPLRDPDGAIIGALRLSRGRDEPPFGEEEAEVARELAVLCGAAFARSRAADVDRLAVETLSKDLAPRPLPDVPGIELEVRYHSGTSQVGVGGDWCEVLKVGDRIMFAVGDAAGHGVDAAVTMKEVASALRAFAFVENAAGVVRRLDRYVSTLRRAGLVTACVMGLDLVTLRLRLANAGHVPPILASRRTTKYLDRGRTAPLGTGSAGKRFGSARLRLRVDDRLFLYTDGLVERRGETIDRGIDRLVRAVVNAPEDLAVACDHILETMAPPGGFEDDVALLAVRLIDEKAARGG
ncbi:MAG: SpoIIE family protein phosphatase [Actinomycetota bacterium]|nr:SpoIIE family protein phosphatase [Actinomycetota bacterium]